jgi:hypothetical protein
MSLEKIDGSLVRSFETDAWPESSTLDFKRISPKRDAEGRNEFLKDVVAFANKDGGDLVYGVATSEDVSSKVMPLSEEPADSLKRRLTAWLDGYIEPRLHCEMKEIQLEQGYVLVVRVPASFSGPHRFRATGIGTSEHYSFPIRSGTATTSMDYEQLRNAFDRTSSLIQRAHEFRTERIAAFRRGEPVVLMDKGPKCIVHIIPLQGVSRPPILDVAKVYHAGFPWRLPHWQSMRKTVNLEGLLVSLTAAKGNYSPGYVQLHRSGALEVVQIGDAQWEKERKLIPSAVVSRFYRFAVAEGIKRIAALGVQGPALVGWSFTQIQGYTFAPDDFPPTSDPLNDRDHLTLPDHLIADLARVSDVDEIARPMLDMLWQAFGEVECTMYDDSGNFISGHAS